MQSDPRVKGGIYLNNPFSSSGNVPSKVTLNTVDSTDYPGSVISSNQLKIVARGWHMLSAQIDMHQTFGDTCTLTLRKNGSGSDFATGTTNQISTISVPYFAAAGDLIAMWVTDSFSGADQIFTGRTATFLHAIPIWTVPASRFVTMQRSSIF